MNIKNGIKNIIFEFIYSFLIIVINFIIRKRIITLIGIELIGLTSLLSQIISLLALAELGISSVMMYHLYKPLEIKDTKKITKLMTLFKKMYHKVCLAILILGLLFLPFLKYFIKDYTLSINYSYVYILFLIQASFTYLFSYKMILMRADQKEYKYKKIFIIFKICTFIIEYIILNKNYYLYLIINIFNTLLLNFIVSKYVDINYPYLKKSNLSKKEIKIINKDIKNTFISKISGVITSSSDTMILSILSNITKLGLYSNYYLIVNTLYTFINKIFNAIESSIGNSIVNKDKKYIYTIYNNLNFISFFFSIFASIFFYLFINFVITIWIGEQYILSNIISICFAIQLFLMIYRTNLWHFIQINGMFELDKITAIIGSSTNIILSIILFKFFDISGVILGTIISQSIQYIIKICYLSKYLNIKINNICHFIIFIIIFTINIILKSYINIFILGISNLLIISIIMIILINLNKYKDLKLQILNILKYKKI